MVRDDVQIHLWQPDDNEWYELTNLVVSPVSHVAKSFLAGTASCRVEVDDVDDIYEQMRELEVLHYAVRGSAVDTELRHA